MSALSPEAKARHRALSEENRQFYIAHGICPMCRKAYADAERVHCGACLRKVRWRAYSDDERHERLKAKKRERRERLKAAGLCVDCGEKAIEGQTLCKACREKHKETNRVYNLRKKIRRQNERTMTGGPGRDA